MMGFSGQPTQSMDKGSSISRFVVKFGRTHPIRKLIG
jgi:hypothetical protein